MEKMKLLASSATQTRLPPFFAVIAKFKRPKGAQASLRLLLDPTAQINLRLCRR
jgi:hypothetical protein